MKLFRYISRSEVEALRNSEAIINTENHRELGRYTNSVGFCFFEYEDEDDITEAYEYISGIVDDYAIVVVDIPQDRLQEGYGSYADPYGAFFDTIQVDEYSTTQYSKDVVIGIYYPNKHLKLGRRWRLENIKPQRSKDNQIQKEKDDEIKVREQYLEQQQKEWGMMFQLNLEDDCTWWEVTDNTPMLDNTSSFDYTPKYIRGRPSYTIKAQMKRPTTVEKLLQLCSESRRLIINGGLRVYIKSVEHAVSEPITFEFENY